MTPAIAIPEVPNLNQNPQQNPTVEAQLRWSSADLELLPDNGNRYEIIDGELYVTRAPHNKHQKTCGRFFTVLDIWSRATNLGEAEIGVGLIFGENDDVIPDVVWITKEKYTALVDASGHFQGAPDLVIEVLSAGTENEKRDREIVETLFKSRCIGILDCRLESETNPSLSSREWCSQASDDSI